MIRSEAIEILRNAGVPDPAGDVRRLEREATHRPAGWFEDAIKLRSERRPVSHIIGRRDFWKHEFKVTSDVLDPRPETELLVELALAQPFTKVLDLGTGSGAIILSLLAERPEATGVGTDISERAVLVAGENAQVLRLTDRVIFPLSDWWDDVGGRYDLIVSNPPYIAADEMAGLAPEVSYHEPRGALTDDADGLTAYRSIAARAAEFMTPGARLLLEIGPSQAKAVSELLREGGLEKITVHPDLDGRDRVVQAKNPIK